MTEHNVGAGRVLGERQKSRLPDPPLKWNPRSKGGSGGFHPISYTKYPTHPYNFLTNLSDSF